ncbi:hypothetical protein EYC80_003530 [Monilinia laxa]|uniref:Uncharacterized protein n=1 Tax=Monilinia laxa TaxID=61186 RepID=A0A5N6KLS8_MONLA|nr:hypothetical protein EYC80_003530 [Monilinia laxa]
MEDQHLIEHRNRETTVKSLASIAEQYIDLLESGCQASDVKLFEIAKVSTTSKMWTKMYEKIHGLGVKSNEMSKKPGLIEHRDYLEEALVVEKKKSAAMLAELEAAERN